MRSSRKKCRTEIGAKLLTFDAAAHIRRSVACSGITASQVSGAEGLEMSVRMILKEVEGKQTERR